MKNSLNNEKNILDEFGLIEHAGIEKWEAKIQEKLNLKIRDLQDSLTAWITNKAEKLSEDFINVAPFGDYSKLLEEPSAITEFFKTELSKPECWELKAARFNKDNNLLQFIFDCKIVDDGESIKGFVFVNQAGKIRHSFAQNQL